jgi:Big-like domain-containing protein/putative pyrroloquinoline-quinone binding quinoprotein
MPGRRLRAPRRLTSSLRFSLAPAFVSLTALAACSAPDEPTSPSASPLIAIKPAAAISDAVRGSGGNAHFYWLPPIAADTIYGGTFDPGLQPQIRICRVSQLPCSVPLVTFPSGTIPVDAAAESYSVVWSTKPANITLDDYRAEVWIAARKMGFADIRVVANARDLKNVPAGFAGVLKSKNLTLAFRLELGIVAAIDITPKNPTIDSGATVQLSATVTDFHNQVIPNAAVTWASVPASIAAVSASGLVTGVSPGIAQVSASSGGAFAADTITVNRPLADWSGAVEWTTYQGNASHTGYNPVVMDTRVFQELWTKSVSSAALNPVTAGEGKVFVTTNAYFGIQQAKSLDARTGTELWSRDFGAIHSVDPPAYANGTVYLQTGGHEDSFLWALDAATGSVRSQTAYLNQWSRYFAPVIVGATVYVAGGYYGGMYAFSATEGVQRWFAALNQYDQFTPAVKDGLVYAYTGLYNPKLTVADAATGAIQYEIADPGFVWDGWSMNTAPTLGGASNLLATNGGRLISFNLLSRSIGYALTSSFRGQPTIANGVVYVVNNAQVEARNESDGALLWSWTPPGQPAGPMIVTRNLLLVSTAASTYAVDLASHTQVWSYAAGGQLALSAQGILFIAQSSGRLTAVSVR